MQAMRPDASDRQRYFAYGSNMSGPRLGARIEGVRALGVAALADHRLAFHKLSHDGSAKCDIAPAPGGRVWGVVFDIPADQRPVLDRFEGLGQGYEIKTVTVALADGGQLSAFSYSATRIVTGLLPYAWYKQHVLHGAQQHGLPADYVAAIASQPAASDPDPERHQRELLIYR